MNEITLENMDEVLKSEWGDIKIRRRRGRRRLSIFLHPLKPIEVRTNLSMPKGQILEFIFQKRQWIENNLLDFTAKKSEFPERKFVEGEEFPLFGQNYRLNFDYNCQGKTSVRCLQKSIILRLPESQKSKASELLRQFYKETAIRYLSQRVEALSKRMNCSPRGLRFNAAKNQWGSCHISGWISLNWKLCVFAPELIDYIVIHELAHLHYLNHSKSFWHLVENFCPDYKVLRKQLRNQEMLVSFLEN